VQADRANAKPNNELFKKLCLMVFSEKLIECGGEWINTAFGI
jgi:hypothetical protein